MKPIKDKKTCTKCKKNKVVRNNFYKSKNPMFDGTLDICIKCIKKDIDYNDMNTVYAFLKQMNVAFDYNVWNSALKSSRDTLGHYMAQCNLGQMAGKTWDDSVFKPEDQTNTTSNQVKNENDNSSEVDEELIDKWGIGYTPEEYRSFERKYAMLKNNYQEKTAMHTEALLTYIRYRVKEELATAKGDSKAAKEWGTLAKDAATAAKINPNQLSKADLSDGIDSFSTLVREVEKAVDIIPILPKFKQRPKDRVDFTIWCYINYIRDLKGLPLAEYSEIYKFYEDFKGMYEDTIEDESDLQ